MTQIKILMKNDLIVESNRLYKLSSIGEILVPKMKTILETFNVLDKNHDYWINQDMTSIPSEFLDEIGKLGDYIEVNPDRNHVFEYPKEVVKHLSESEKVMITSSFFLPIYPSLCIELAAKGTDITLVFTEYVYDRMLNDYKKELEHFLNLQLCCQRCPWNEHYDKCELKSSYLPDVMVYQISLPAEDDTNLQPGFFSFIRNIW